MSTRPVVVFVGSTAGAADEPSLQALTLARGLAPGNAVHAVVVNDAAAAAGLGAYGATTVHVACHPALGLTTPDALARVVGDLARSLDAGFVVGPGGERGNSVLARVAARWGLPFVANCVAIDALDPLSITRQRWGGSVLEQAVVHADQAVLSVAPHAVAAAAVSSQPASVETLEVQLDAADLVVRATERVPAAAGGVSLAHAAVVVGGGRGVGSAEGFAALDELAGLLGAAVGCSRAVTINGWRPHTDQVGQTGTKIAPDLYIACGISGASQHVAGTRGAKRLLAINTDPEAPIISSADYAVIADLHTVVPAISAEIRRIRGA